MSASADPSDTRDREIVTTREVAAPRELVWRLWTEAEHIAQWWGPTGFTTTTSEMDVRPGGRWRFVFHGPDGRDYPNLITYLEVAAPDRLVYRHGGEAGVEAINFTTTVTFETLPGATPRTRVTMRAVFPSKAALDHVAEKYGAREGGKQTMARFAELAERMATTGGGGGSAPFVTRRVVRAPRDLVYKVWTELEHLQQWFGPKGCTLEHCSLDLRPGGAFLYCMRFGTQGEMWGKWVFREVSRDRLVFVSSFADAQGNVVRAPFSDEWPLETLSTVTFEEHAGIGRGTVVTLTGSPIGATAAEQAKFDGFHDSMHQGWGGTFEQLEAHLARCSS